MGKELPMAVNKYRQSGGGGFPAVKPAPVVYNRQKLMSGATVITVS